MTIDVTPYPIVSTGLKRHGHQYGESDKFRQWIRDTLSPLISIQAAFFSLLDIDLDTAEGVKLDLIGRLVGAPAYVPNVNPIAGRFGFRNQELAETFGETDDSSIGGYWRNIRESSYSSQALTTEMYRKVIRAQIIKNSSLCTPPDIIKIARMLLPDDVTFEYVEYPMIIMLTLRVDLSRFYVELLRLMLPRPCGVGMAIINGYYDDFGFKDQAYALPFGELDDPEIGGFWTTLHEDLRQNLYYNGERIWL